MFTNILTMVGLLVTLFTNLIYRQPALVSSGFFLEYRLWRTIQIPLQSQKRDPRFYHHHPEQLRQYGDGNAFNSAFYYDQLTKHFLYDWINNNKVSFQNRSSLFFYSSQKQQLIIIKSSLEAAEKYIHSFKNKFYFLFFFFFYFFRFFYNYQSIECLLLWIIFCKS